MPTQSLAAPPIRAENSLKRRHGYYTLPTFPAHRSPSYFPTKPDHIIMYASASRRALGSLIPPKIASPAAVVRPAFLPLIPHSLISSHPSLRLLSSLFLSLRSPAPRKQSSGGTSTRTQSVISFYSKLPKGPEPAAQKSTGLRGKYFEGANASG
jgi:hypothetical protein